MRDPVIEYLNKLRSRADSRSAIWYAFVVIMLAITWSGVKAVQTNYNLQKQIARLKQQNTVLSLENQNQGLTNQYLSSSQYEDLAARQNLGLASPGETVVLVPHDVAMKYINQSLVASASKESKDNAPKEPPKVIRNLESWRDFLLGRTILSD